MVPEDWTENNPRQIDSKKRVKRTYGRDFENPVADGQDPLRCAYVPYFYIEDYALELGVKQEVAFYLISIINVGSFFGRFLPAWLADK